MSDGLSLIHRDGYHELRFTRPAALNTLTLAVIRALDGALMQVAENRPRCLLITAEGRAFMAGGDLGYLAEAKERAPDEARIVIDALNTAMLRLNVLPCPSVIAVQGAVAGAGMSLLLACDLAIGADTAKFVFAYDKIAATPDGGMSWSLPRAVGLRHAMRIALSGKPVTSEEALSLGLLGEVVPEGDLQSAAQAAAARLANGPTQAFVATRRLMQDGGALALADHLDAERDSFCALAGTRDFRIAIDAFFARRPPDYRGL